MTKRAIFLSLLLLACFQPWNIVLAQSNESYYEDRIRTLTARLDDLTQAHADLVQAFNKLQRQYNVQAQEIANLRSAVQNPKAPDLSGAASVDSVKQLKSALVSLEERLNASDAERKRDNKRILDQFDKLAKTAANAIRQPAPSKIKSTPKEPAYVSPTGKQYDWVVSEGETLSQIVQIVKASGGNTSMEAIMKANPGLKPNTIRIGQKIIVPELGK